MSHEKPHENPHKLQLMVAIGSITLIVLVLSMLSHYAAMASTMIPADTQTQSQN